MTIRTLYIFSGKGKSWKDRRKRLATGKLSVCCCQNWPTGKLEKIAKSERDLLPEIAKAFARKKVEKERLKIASYKRTKRQKPRHNNNENSQKFKFKTLTDFTLPPSVPAGKKSFALGDWADWEDIGSKRKTGFLSTCVMAANQHTST